MTENEWPYWVGALVIAYAVFSRIWDRVQLKKLRKIVKKLQDEVKQTMKSR